MILSRFRIRAACLLPMVFLAHALLAGEATNGTFFEADVMMPMRDGTKLAANIWKPEGTGPFPVILMRSPYGKMDEKWGEAKRYTTAGYVMVVQDCRGRGKSEGAWDPFRFDGADGFDTQEWIGRQPWCNGDIGTSGGSYVGWTQWAATPNASRHLKAMAPVVPFGNSYELAYVGGAFQLSLMMGWGAGVGGIALSQEQMTKAFRYLPLNTFASQFEKKVPYLTDWVQHPGYDDYWKQRGIDYRYEAVTIPALNIGGWYDIFSKTTIELVNSVRASSRDRAARRNQFVVMGPWTHGVGARKAGELDFGPEAALNLGDLQFKWFEYWLKNHETGVQDWPACYLFIMGENKWRGESEWPLKRTRFTSWYLRSPLRGDGSLATTAPGEEKGDEFVYDPNDPVPSVGGNNLVGTTSGAYDQARVEERKDVLVYNSEPLAEDLEVTGPVKMNLWAASTARDTDFTAKLVDAHPDGKAYNLCEGIIRARYRKDPANPALLEPGHVEPYEIDLWVTANLFKRGHRIRVEISSSNFPRFDRNPNTGDPFGTGTNMISATQTILHDREHPSHLVLPVIPR